MDDKMFPAGSYLLKFPVFSFVLDPRLNQLWIQDQDSGVVFFPLFTDRPAAETFAQRSGFQPGYVSLISMAGNNELLSVIRDFEDGVPVLIDPYDIHSITAATAFRWTVAQLRSGIAFDD